MVGLAITYPVFTYTRPEKLFDINEVIDPVANRAEKADEFALEILGKLDTAITDLKNSTDLNFDEDFFRSAIDDPSFDISDGGLSGINFIDPVAPDLTPPIVTAPDVVIPDLPEMQEFVSKLGDIPTFDVVRPPIEIPDKPADEFPTFNDTAPTASSPIIPLKPDYVLPPIPLVDDVVIPSPPEYNIVPFDGVMPVDDLTPPEEMFVFNEVEYSSALKDQVASELLEQIIAGGTGLDAETEQAIWDRAIARKQDEDDQMYQEALEFHSSRGFSLPDGVLNATIIEVSDRISRRNDDLNNDILVQQSKLAQENTHFIITSAIQWEKELMANANTVQQRAFEVAKARVEMANEIYRIKVEAFIAQLEGYKVQATVYETRIKAEVAKAEFYKAQIEGVKAGVEANSLLIEAYKAQLEGIKSLIQMYATEMEAARIQADIDKLAVDTYKVKAEVYGLKVGAIVSKYNAWQAEIAGETEKIKMYVADADAYEAKIKGYQAVADVENSQVQLLLAEHQGNIETYKGAITHYTAESERLITKAQVEAEIQGLDVDIYKADVDAYGTKVDAIIRNYLGKVDLAKAQAEILLKEKEVEINKVLAEKGLTSDMILGQTKIGSQLVAAALTSISASASLGMTMSQGETYGQSNTYSDNPSYHITTDYYGGV